MGMALENETPGTQASQALGIIDIVIPEPGAASQGAPPHHTNVAGGGSK